MPKSFAEHLCHSRGGSIGRPSRRLLRAALGMEVPEDDESTRSDYSDLADATHFEPRSRVYAEGGEVERDPSDWPHKEHELPDERPPWYEGETAKTEHDAKAREDEDGEDETPAAVASRLALGGIAKPRLGSGKRFAHLTHQLEGRGDVKDPKALAAAIGRKALGSERFNKLAEKGRERAEHHAHGGFAAHMARRLRIRSAMGGR